MDPTKRIDLHTHTFFSDGVLLPSEQLRRAVAKGYGAIAITDHADSSIREAIRSETQFGVGAARAPQALPRALRPRAKLFARGARCLSQGELLSLLLGGGQAVQGHVAGAKLHRVHARRDRLPVGHLLAGGDHQAARAVDGAQGEI